MCGTWPPSAKLDFQRNYILTITHLGSPLPTYLPNFVKIFWSGADIRSQDANKLYVWCISTICQIGFSKETCLDHSTPWGSSLPIYSLNFVKISWSGAEICPKMKFKTGPLVAEFYFQLKFWQLSSFGDLPVYGPSKFQKNRSMCSWVICDSTFSIPTCKPTLPMAQCHHAGHLYHQRH